MKHDVGATVGKPPDVQRHAGRSALGKWTTVLFACIAGTVTISPSFEAATIGELGALRVSSRTVEPRLTGFRYAPLQRGTIQDRSAVTGAQWSIAGSIIERSAGDVSPRSRHACAVAHLVVGDPESAIELLTQITEESRDAATWSDLAAAYMDRARHTNNPALLVDAVAAADAAIEIAPGHREAHFNRALAVDRLGLRDEALAAWTAFLQVEPSGGWADEARMRQQVRAAPVLSFEAATERDSHRLVAGDRNAASDLVRQFPRESRLRVEREELPAWGAASRVDTDAAARHLSFSRSIAGELAHRGDRFLSDAIGVIDRTKQPALGRLAAAHATYGQGWQIWSSKRPTAAEPLLRDAARQFAEMGSPMGLASQYYLAVAVFDQNRVGEARAILESALRDAPVEYPALRAQFLWQLGRVHGAEAKWGAAIQALAESAAIFDRIGERLSASIVRQILSEVYDTIGDSASAWRLRFHVLRDLGMTTNLRTQTAVSAISYDAAQHRRWRAALSFLNVEIAMAPQAGDPPSLIDALLRRAVAHHFLGRKEPARRDLSEATRVTRALTDGGLQTRALADVFAVEAVLTSTPHESVAKLTQAIDFHRAQGRRMYLPAFYLQRGRALREMGDDARARRDFEQGILVLEADRETLPDAASRLGIFDASEELFLEAISAALQYRQAEDAFDYAERARARALLDAMGRTVDVRRDVPEFTAVIEYVFLRQRLVIFIVDRGGVEAVETPASDEVIAARAARYRDALANGRKRDVLLLGDSLYRTLIEPIANRIAGKKELVFVPDHRLASIPFAALRRQDGRFVVQDHTVVTAPSAAVFFRTRRLSATRRVERVLVVAAPAEGDAVRLDGTLREAALVGQAYPRPVSLLGSDATSSQYRSHAPSADVIHFAGHGQSAADDGAETSLLFTDRKVTREEIESLKLYRAPVVVLAGCNTARGEVRWTEGTLSVARAFLAAGASSVIATLWPIEDGEAAEFFSRLHTHLATGASAAEALRATQLESRGETGATTWAAVQIFGE